MTNRFRFSDKRSLRSDKSTGGNAGKVYTHSFSVSLLYRFNFSATRVKHGLGIPVRRLASLEDKVQGRLKGDATVVVGRHIAIVRVAAILAVDDLCHALERLDDHFFRHDVILQPIGDVLA